MLDAVDKFCEQHDDDNDKPSMSGADVFTICRMFNAVSKGLGRMDKNIDGLRKQLQPDRGHVRPEGSDTGASDNGKSDTDEAEALDALVAKVGTADPADQFLAALDTCADSIAAGLEGGVFDESTASIGAAALQEYRERKMGTEKLSRVAS